jgi:hypothetical protein
MVEKKNAAVPQDPIAGSYVNRKIAQNAFPQMIAAVLGTQAVDSVSTEHLNADIVAGERYRPISVIENRVHGIVDRNNVVVEIAKTGTDGA